MELKGNGSQIHPRRQGEYCRFLRQGGKRPDAPVRLRHPALGDSGEFFQHQARRPRRLLLHKREGNFKLEQQTSQKGCSLVALKLYWKNGKVKLALGLGKGKTHRDQRYDLKARVEMREAQREVARINRR